MLTGPGQACGQRRSLMSAGLAIQVGEGQGGQEGKHMLQILKQETDA